MSKKLDVSHLNHTHSVITCDDDVTRELRAYLTFDDPNAQFSPKYRAKLWNGKITLIDRNGCVYRGLLHIIRDWAQKSGYSINGEDQEDQFSIKEALDFIDTLNLPKHIEVRDYQVKSFVRAIRRRRRLFLSPTSSGKSLIIYFILRYLHANHSKRTLVVVPTTALVAQLATDFVSYGFDSDSFIHRIYEGETKQTAKPIIISTWQGIQHQPKKWFAQFDTLVGDEAHLFQAKSLQYIASSCVNAVYRIGLTGTLDDSLTHKLILEGLFGEVYRAATTKELQDRGYVTPLEIKALVLKYGPQTCAQTRHLSYADEMTFLCENEARNRFISNLALSQTRNTLVLFQYVEKHGKILRDMISLMNPDANRKVFFIYGQTDVEEREYVRKIVEQETNAIIIASYGTFSTGTNIKNLHNVIFASGSKSRIRNLQSIGRTLRLNVDKDKAVLFDIADDLRSGLFENYAFKHFFFRIQIYIEEKFKFKLYKIVTRTP